VLLSQSGDARLGERPIFCSIERAARAMITKSDHDAEGLADLRACLRDRAEDLEQNPFIPVHIQRR
jgi:hypothetical protein